MFTTIRGKLLAVMLSFVFITILTSMLAFNYFVEKKDSLSDIAQKTENTHVLLLQDIKTMHSFFENETINPSFFYTGTSELINKHQKICTEIREAFKQLELLEEKNDFALADTINNLNLNFLVYTEMVDNIINQILKRGFKDYGIEGKMRLYAHQLESQYKEIGMINILQLRRHEKDFIIRQEDQYVKKHWALVSEIQEKIDSDKNIDQIRRSRILRLLSDYSSEFRTLVIFEKKLGLRNYGGLKKQIDETSGKIESSLSSLVKTSKVKVEDSVVKMEILYLVVGLIFLLISIISAGVISKIISRSISELKNKIGQFVDSDFTQRTVLPINNSINEIDALITNVSVMEQHIVNQMVMLKQSNKDLEMLLYATSRDIKSPLITVKRLVEIAHTKTADKTMLMYLKMMREAMESLHNIIDELGIITNIRSIETKPEVIDLEKMIKAVYTEFSSMEQFGNIIFSLDMKLQNGLFSSPALLRAIFRNLIENSIKYTTKRKSQSFIKIAVFDQNEDAVRIEISDNGIGIKTEYHEKIFDMFFRGTDYASGTGLGLYIVKCALDKLNGAINLESNENEGSTFSIIVPNNTKVKNLKGKIIEKIEIFSLTEAII